MANKIKPHDQIQLNSKLVSNLLNSYSLYLINFTEIKAGVENTSVFLKTDKGNFVLRVYRRNNKSLKGISQEIRFMDFLRGQNIPVPEILINVKGKFISQAKINNLVWNYILMEFVEGKHLTSNQYSFIPATAKYQALMHRASRKFKKAEKFNTLKEKINVFISRNKKAEKFLKSNPLRLGIEKVISQITFDLKNNFKKFDNLPSGLVHMDYDSDNILVNKDKLTAILDFDDLSYEPFVADLGSSLWWWLFMNREKDFKFLLNKYLKEYQKYHKLSQKELEFLPLFVRMRNISVAMFDIDNIKKKSQKEWKKVLDFDVEAISKI